MTVQETIGWDDWCPVEQTAEDFLKAALETGGHNTDDDDHKEGSEEEDEDEEDEDWCPDEQGAAAADEEDDDDDWAPTEQGAADLDKGQEGALVALLTPAKQDQDGPEMFEDEKEAKKAGKTLWMMRREPTVEEAKEEIDPNEDARKVAPPRWRDVSEDEALVLLERRAHPALADPQTGRICLHRAAEKAMPDLCKKLIENNAPVDARDNYGETPMMWLSHTRHFFKTPELADNLRVETMQALMARGADVHAMNPRGRTALHLASTENDGQAIECLLDGGADVNAKDLAGFTPLIWAAGRGGEVSVKMLLDYEADMNIQANRGQTAMTFALTNGNNAIVDILEKHKMIKDKEEETKKLAEKAADQDDKLAKKDEEHEADDGFEPLAMPKLNWASTAEKPDKVAGYEGRRVFKLAKPDRRSNVY